MNLIGNNSYICNKNRGDIMLDVIEDSRNEFKIKLTPDLEEIVIGFLNSKDGGNIYIGVNDNGEVIGLKNNLDLLQRKIKDLIVSNIEPSVLGLFDIEVLKGRQKIYTYYYC